MQLGVLASGRGSNLAAIIGSIKRGRISSKLAVVISNVADAGVLGIARRHDIPAVHLSPKEFDSSTLFDQALLDTLNSYEVDLILLAGYLKKISSFIIREYRDRIINIHPALLPAFGGKGMYGQKVHRAVLDYGCKVSGVTVHFVDESYDNGPPILQKCVRVEEGDTLESLAARVLEQEHTIFTEAVKLFEEKRVEVNGRKVIINDA